MFLKVIPPKLHYMRNFNISMHVRMLLYPIVHYDDSFYLICRQILLKAEIIFVEFRSILYV